MACSLLYIAGGGQRGHAILDGIFPAGVAKSIVPDFDAKVAKRNGWTETAISRSENIGRDYDVAGAQLFRENTPAHTYTTTTEGADLMGKKVRANVHPLSYSNTQQRNGQTRTKNTTKVATTGALVQKPEGSHANDL